MRLNKIIIILITMFGFMSVVNAECPYDENVNLSSYASNVKVGYEYIQNGDSLIYNIEIFNLIPNIRVEATNDVTKDKFKGDYIDGNTSFYYENSTVQSTHTFKIFANSSNCYDILLRTIKLVTPKFNKYSLRPECTTYPDYDLCQRFYPTSITEETFINKLNNDSKKKNSGRKETLVIYETFGEFVEKNRFIIGGVAITVLIVTIIIVIIMKVRRRKKIGF